MADPRIGTELAGYRIESLLGRGGMSVVYLAEDLRLKRRAALKVLAPELAMDASFRERFIAESELAAGLDHPNVIPIFEAGEANGVLFIAMRFVQSTDLKALITRDGRLSPERALSIVGQTASALDAAHQQGLVHRDVKPANILVAEGQGAGGADHVYLADFGLTKRAQQRTGLTRTGQFVGTVDYVAPEQIEGKDIDGRTDEYALACVLYECLAGESPYPKDDETSVLIAHLMDPVPSIRAVRPELPPEFDQVLQAGMAKKKEGRYSDCVSFARAASDAMGVGGSSATRVVAPPGSGTFEPAPPTAGETRVAGPPPLAGVPSFSAPPTGELVIAAPPPTAQPPPRAFEPAPSAQPPGGARQPPRKGRSRLLTIIGAAVAAAVVAALLVVLLGKGGGDGGQSESPGPGISSPPETIQSFAPGTNIYVDDFSDNSGGWDETSQGGFHDGVRDGVYFQTIKQNNPNGPQVFASSTARDPAVQSLGDVSITVTATKVAGAGANGYGLACRTRGGTVSYYFVVGSTGGWAIEKSDGVNQPVLANGTDPIIKKGNNAPNEIRGDCVGGADGGTVALTLFVNGKQIGTTTDTPDAQVPGDSPGTIASGTVGVVSVGNKGLEVHFDDFRVKAPG